LPHFGATRIVARKIQPFDELSALKFARYRVKEVMKTKHLASAGASTMRARFAALTCTLIGDAYMWFAFLLL
jgi:hypothetical protein